MIDQFNTPSAKKYREEGSRANAVAGGQMTEEQFDELLAKSWDTAQEAKIRADERKRVLAEVEGWLVDEFTEEIDWICPKCRAQVGEGKYCTYDRSKPIKEVFKWADLIQEARNELRAELGAKVQEMKGSDVTR